MSTDFGKITNIQKRPKTEGSTSPSSVSSYNRTKDIAKNIKDIDDTSKKIKNVFSTCSTTPSTKTSAVQSSSLSNLKNQINEVNNQIKWLSFHEADTDEDDTKIKDDEDIVIKTESDLKRAKEKILKMMEDVFADDGIMAIADEGLNINGKLDESMDQKGTGDCYFLTTLNALNSTKEGKEIINNLITRNEKFHTYTVTFPGVKQSYTFSSLDIANAEKKNYVNKKDDGTIVGEGSSWYSEGDDDALLLEMAFEKFREECKEGKFDDKDWPDYAKAVGEYNDNKSALSGGAMNQVMYVLTGRSIQTVDKENMDNVLDIITYSKSSFAVYGAIDAANGYKSDEKGLYYKNENGDFLLADEKTPSDNTERYSFKGKGSNKDGHITLNGTGVSEGDSIVITSNSEGGHALAITNVTEDTVTLINPWHGNKEVTVKREDFEEYAYNLQFARVSDDVNTPISAMLSDIKSYIKGKGIS